VVADEQIEVTFLVEEPMTVHEFLSKRRERQLAEADKDESPPAEDD
jgi:hypothetical protein